MASLSLARARTANGFPDPAATARRWQPAALERLLERLWHKRLLPVPTLDPDELIAKAARSTGLPVIEGCWRERLDILTGSIAEEASLNGLGRVIAHGQLVMVLKQRLRWEALWHRHPEIADYPIAAPILIVGQMRSGTTRMQRLLACDPRLTFTRFYECWTPFAGDPASPIDFRPLRAWAGLRFAHLLNPDFRHIHPARATEADEEIGLQGISIFGAAFEAQWRVPGFAAHLEAADTQPVYAEFKRILQTVGWLRRGTSPRPWVLKLPQFAQDLDAVLATFPDARIVQLDRDPVAVVASSASLVRNQMELQSDRVDPSWIGREWLRKTRLREDRRRAALARFAGPQVTIGFDALSADWRDEVARAYQMLELRHEPLAQARMGAFLAASRHATLARHRYDLAEFELEPAAVRMAMAKPAQHISG